jgi:hypothetical protein
MKGWVLFPSVACVLGTVIALAVGLCVAISQPSSWGWLIRAGLVLIFPLGFLIILVLCSFLFVSLKARPTDNWQEEAKEADAALIFAYGLGKPVLEKMQPGESNRELLGWTLKNTGAPILLVQEGVWVAVCPEEDKECAKKDKELLEILRMHETEKSGNREKSRTLFRMHEHSNEKYVNTGKAAFYAVDKLIGLKAKNKVVSVVVIAHDLQLKLAAWDVWARP